METAFQQREPLEGIAATEPTQVAVAYDNEAVYFRLELRDSKPKDIHARLTRRDDPSASDWVTLWLGTQGDERAAYRFSVNPLRVKQDARVYNGVDEDAAWDAVWQVATRRTDLGWSAEIRIPFSQIRYDPHRSTWRFQIERVLQRKREHSFFSPYPKRSNQLVRYMGRITGLKELPNPIHLELLPYARLGAKLGSTGNRPLFALGGDARLRLSPELTLDLTINPDFGQVEADPSELNLTVYETYFAEKRPFFIEGRELLDYGLRWNKTNDTLYYSRRIGSKPRVDLGVDASQLVDYPNYSTIIGASKLTGKTSDGWSIGILEAVTGTESAGVRTPTPGWSKGSLRPVSAQTDEHRVAPVTQYAVARVTKDIAHGKTLVGGMVTGMSRALGSTLWPDLPRTAVSGGLDLDHREGDFHIIGKVFGSEVAGSPAAIQALQESSVHFFQRPDAHHLKLDPTRTSLTGWGTTVAGGKLSGAPWRGAWGGTIISPGFDPNELGFLQRADERSGYLWLEYRDDGPGSFYKSYWIDSNAWITSTFGNEITALGGNLSGNLVFPSQAYLYIGGDHQQSALDPRVMRGGPSFRVPAKHSIWAGGGTDDRKSVSVDVNTWAGIVDSHASWWVGGQIAAKFRPLPSIELAFTPWYQHSLDGYQYVELDESVNQPIVGRLLRDTASLTVRGNWAISPDFTVQLYLMPYFSAGRYQDFFHVVSPKSEEFKDHFARTDYKGDHQFLYEQLRSNLVLRWEYEPGSTTYLVWTHEQGNNRTDRGGLVVTRDFGDLLSRPSSDLIMLKWAHRLAL